VGVRKRCGSAAVRVRKFGTRISWFLGTAHEFILHGLSVDICNPPFVFLSFIIYPLIVKGVLIFY
jgi:hypothetical protein